MNYCLFLSCCHYFEQKCLQFLYIYRLGGGLFGDTHVGEYSGLKVAVTRITVNIHDDQISSESLKALTDEVWFLRCVNITVL